MITVIIPSRNRLFTLTQCIASYLQDERVTKVLLIDDGSEPAYRATGPLNNPRVTIVRNETRRGALDCRMLGLQLADSEYVGYGEDDAEVSAGYFGTLVEALEREPMLGCISGALIQMKAGESIGESKKRYTLGPVSEKMFSLSSGTVDFSLVPNGRVTLPYTHALFVGRRELLWRAASQINPSDYKCGNGYREESVLQACCLRLGYKNAICSDVFAFHYARAAVKSGGQRMNRLSQYRWALQNNRKFFRDFYPHIHFMATGRAGDYNAFVACRFALALFARMFVLPLVRKLSR